MSDATQWVRREPERVLVITLATDEPQLPLCAARILEQRDVCFEHVVIQGLSNLDAHQSLMDLVEDRAEDFDLFVKVDADMVLKDAWVLHRIAAWFRARPTADHAIFAVDDFFTARPMMGLHVYSHRARWLRADEPLFVDPAPIITGESHIVTDSPAPVSDHAPEPSPDQAFYFGVHRALKAVQPDHTQPFRASQAGDQWRILLDVWANYQRTGDARLAHTLVGAMAVIQGRLDLAARGYRSEEDRARVLAARGDDLLTEGLARFWASRMRRNLARSRALGPMRVVRLGVSKPVTWVRGARDTRRLHG